MEEGNAEMVKNATELALSEGLAADIIISQALLPKMEEIGREFRSGNIFIPDVLMSSRAMHASLYVLKPLVIESLVLKKKGRVIIGTVAGDLHDIGKNLVSMTLQGDGYEVIDLGIDVPVSAFVAAIERYRPDVLAMSALLTTTMVEFKNVIKAITDEGMREQVKIVIGGGPVSPDYIDEVGANGYGKDVFEALASINRLLGNKEGYINV
ncbi:corrinoid protein [Eubacteriaceae bacterium ES2]|nr:corrinoid protein [Eubacteriaceae bacterium ES2]